MCEIVEIVIFTCFCDACYNDLRTCLEKYSLLVINDGRGVRLNEPILYMDLPKRD